MGIKVGDNVIINSNKNGFRGEPAKVCKMYGNKVQLMTLCDNCILDGYTLEELLEDRPIMLSEVLNKIAFVAEQKHDYSDYDYDDNYHPDDEYIGWQNALNWVIDELIGKEND